MKITSKELFPEENQGTIQLQTQGTTRVTVGGDGSVAVPGALALSGAATFSGGSTLTGAVSLGGASDTVGFFGATPVAAQSATATSGTFTANAGTAAVSGSSWTGNTGSKAYTVHDIVSALKKYGMLGA